MKQYVRSKGKWKVYTKVRNADEKSNEPCYEWVECPLTNVPTSRLIEELETLSWELTTKEIELTKVKTEFAEKEFRIKYVDDIDFKQLYGKENDDTRGHHVKIICEDLIKQKTDLEISIDFLKREINLFKTVIKYNGHRPVLNTMPYPVEFHRGDDFDRDFVKEKVMQAVKESVELKRVGK